MKSVCILEITAYRAQNCYEFVENAVVYRQYASIGPQLVANWLKKIGCHVQYVVYHGLGNPLQYIDWNIDILMVSVHTHCSLLAYAISAYAKKRGIKTVISGPHARSFTFDCQRFFDVVVIDCSISVVKAIVRNEVAPREVVTSKEEVTRMPSVLSREPYFRNTHFINGMPHIGSVIPVFSSIGCTEACPFCVDWNREYKLLNISDIIEDFRFLSNRYSGVKVVFHDPNFGVSGQEVASKLAEHGYNRNPILIQSSLATISESHLANLRRVNCVYLAPGIETWSDCCSRKVGYSVESADSKLEHIVNLYRLIKEYIPYSSANIILGLDVDYGKLPFDTTKWFCREFPWVFPSITMPFPFGKTPYYSVLLKQNRILKNSPFCLYHFPFLVMKVKNYDACDFLSSFLDAYNDIVSLRMIVSRSVSSGSIAGGIGGMFRTVLNRIRLLRLKEYVASMKRDKTLQQYHNSTTMMLPEYYKEVVARKLGPLATLLSRRDITPIHNENFNIIKI